MSARNQQYWDYYKSEKKKNPKLTRKQISTAYNKKYKKKSKAKRSRTKTVKTVETYLRNISQRHNPAIRRYYKKVVREAGRDLRTAKQRGKIRKRIDNDCGDIIALNSMKVKELKKLAATLGIRGFSTMRKTDLVALLVAYV